MTSDLTAQFQLKYPLGPEIEINFRQPTHGFSVTALIGPSGCGKTTLLRCLAGLTNPDEGTIQYRDQTWFDRSRQIALRPQQRDVGFLFQEYALFPHMTSAENIGYGLGHWTTAQRRERVAQIVRKLDLTGLEHRLPYQLSGGQQQRVALGRMLARRPRILLLDEPLSALDALLREKLRGELRQILLEFEVPAIVVTHDRVEAIALADHVAVLDQGQIQQMGSVEEVFSRPKNAALALLVGVETVVAGEITSIDQGLAAVQVGHTPLLAVAPSVPSRYVHVCIKGEDVALQKGPPGSTTIRNQLRATIKSLTPEGPLVRVGLECGFELTALITRPAKEELQLQIGDTVMAMVKTPAIHLIPRTV